MWQMELGGKQKFEADPCGKNHSIHLSDGHCLFFCPREVVLDRGREDSGAPEMT